METSYVDSWSDRDRPCDMDLWVMKWRSAWSSDFVLYLEDYLMYVHTSYFGSMNEYDPTFDLRNKIDHCDLYSMVQWLCLISWRLFDVSTLLVGIMSQYDPKFDLKRNIGLCDLYFMVQGFCLISWRLFDVCTSYFGCKNQYDTTWPRNQCRSLWPLFHGPVILPYVLKTIWCMNIIIWDYESVWPQNKYRSLWPIFHGPVILPYILKTIWRMYIIPWAYKSERPNVWLKN